MQLHPILAATSRAKTALKQIIGVSVVINILMLISPLYMLQVYDRVLVSGSQSTLIFLTLFAVLALIVLALLDAMRSMILSKAAVRYEQSTTQFLFPKIIEKGLTTGQIRDAETVKSFLSSPALTALFDAPWVPVYIIIVYTLHPLLGHVALVGAILLFCLALLNEWITKEPQRKANGESQAAANLVELCSRQQNATFAMGMAPALSQRWGDVKNAALFYHLKTMLRSNGVTANSKAIRLTLQVAILGVGAYLVIQQVSTPGVMIAASIIMSRGLAPIEASISGWKLVISARDANERLHTLVETFPDAPELTPLPEPTGALHAENVIFTHHPEHPPTLKNVTLNLPAGTVCGITGANASGKSTLGKLLLGMLMPTHGKVTLDNASYDQWDRANLGKHIGYLPQHIELFPGTVAENIARFTECDPQLVIEAAQMANAHELIVGLENGYSFEISSQLDNLSGGQKQRIALARALFNYPKVVLLDEPSSSLDAAAEQSVIHAINALKANGTTVIVIGHRPTLMNTTHHLVVMDKGVIAQQGPTQELLQTLIKPTIKPAAQPAAKTAGKTAGNAK